MKIVHVSFARVRVDDPSRWLDTLGYYTGLLETMAREHEVHSIHGIGLDQSIVRNGVHYEFLKYSVWKNVSRLYKIIETLRPDAVILHGIHHTWHVWNFCRLFSGLNIYAQHHAERPFVGWKKYFHRQSDERIKAYFFASAEFGRDWVQRDLISVDKKIVEVMEVSSEFTPGDKLVARNDLGLSLHERVYLWVGRADKNKDLSTLITAFKRFSSNFSNVRLLIIGAESSKSDLSGSDKIASIGKVHHAKMETWFRAADFIVSTSHYEGSGVAVCEGLSCGCTPILTEIPSFKFMTQNWKVGLKFPAGSAEALEQAFNESVKIDPDVQRKTVRDHFEKHLSFEAIARTMIDCIQFNSNMSRNDLAESPRS